MVKISEKRSLSIPPTRIDKELLTKVGRILKAHCPKEHEISIQVYSDYRNIITEDFEELKSENVEIPSDTYKIEMTIRHHQIVGKTPIQIEMDLRRPRDSKLRVMGENATWVHGVTELLSEAFSKKKLGYSYIAKSKNLRSLISLATSLLLAYAIGSVVLFFGIESEIAFGSGAISLLVAMSLTDRFFDWVFPYFEIESEDFLPPKVRKWTLAILWGSGIIPSILLWIFSQIGQT